MAGDLVPASRFSVESWAKNSRFISTIGPSFSVEDAKNFIEEINLQYADATHNVPVYVIGSGASVTAHSSDDGEPSGTAGKPALSVLMGSGLGDTTLVITRYFGGTKLGTGGLVKAYSSAAKFAVNGVPKARKIKVHRTEIISPYNLHDKLYRLIKQHHGLNINQKYTEHVQIDFLLPPSDLSALQTAVNQLSQGQIEVLIREKDLVALQPVHTPEDQIPND